MTVRRFEVSANVVAHMGVRNEFHDSDDCHKQENNAWNCGECQGASGGRVRGSGAILHISYYIYNIQGFCRRTGI